MKGPVIGRLRLDNPLVMAPMAGITDLPFRRIVRSFGAALCFTEMISANGLVRAKERTLRYLASGPDDKPLGVQLFGADPAVLAAAAAAVEAYGADLVDVNMGCPVKKVVKMGAGAALLRDPERARTIIHAMRGATALPLTVKIRSGWDAGSINVVMIARIAEGEGADAVIVHPRTALQSFSGEADWRRIAEVKQEIRIPVIGNGDIRTAEDPLRMIKETDCDAVMIGRAVLGNPWLFRHAGDFFDCGCCRAAPQAGDRGKVIFDHLKMNEALYGREHGLRRFRSHLLWYTKGLPGGVRFRKEAQAIEDRDGLMRAIDDFLASFS